jgi:hypothetical protein
MKKSNFINVTNARITGLIKNHKMGCPVSHWSAAPYEQKNKILLNVQHYNSEWAVFAQYT